MKMPFMALMLLGGCATGHAEQPATLKAPAEQALGEKLMQEINAGLSCNAAIITVQRQLDEARKQIEELQLSKSKDAK